MCRISVSFFWTCAATKHLFYLDILVVEKRGWIFYSNLAKYETQEREGSQHDDEKKHMREGEGFMLSTATALNNNKQGPATSTILLDLEITSFWLAQIFAKRNAY